MNAQDLARAGWAGMVLGTALLAGCGGGGGGGDSGAPPVATTPPPAPVPPAAPAPSPEPPPAPPPPVIGVEIPADLSVTGTAVTDVSLATAFSSTAAATPGLSFAWTFGDGATSAEPSPTHDYVKVGNYPVGLTVTNAAGASKTVSFAVSVNNRSHVKGLNCSRADSGGWCWQAPLPTGSAQSDTLFLDGLNGWSVGENGEILRTVDGGKTWQNRASGVTTRLTGVRFGDALNGWAVGDGGVVLRTTDGGTTWTRMAVTPTGTSGVQPQARGTGTFLFASGDGTWATGDGGATWVTGSMGAARLGDDGTVWSAENWTLSKSVDLGKTRTVVLALTGPTSMNSYQVFGQTVVVMATISTADAQLGSIQSASIRRSTDGGQTWETIAPQGLPTQQNLSPEMRFRDALNGGVVIGGTLYRTQDGGRTWASMSNPTGVTQIRSLANGVWARLYSPTAWEMTEDDGLTWTPVALGSGGYVRLNRVDALTWTMTDYDGSVTLSIDGAKTWTQVVRMTSVPSTEMVTATWFFDAKRGLAQRSGGRVMATADGGRSWTVKATGIGTGGSGLNPLRMQFADENLGWTLSADGRLFRTENGGGRWTPTISFANTGQVARAFHFVDASTGFAFVVEGAAQTRVVLATVDGGVTWTRQADLGTSVSMVRSLRFSSALKGVMVGDAGAVAVTSDGGQTWTWRTPVSGARLNEAAYSDAGTLWVVGDGGVLRASKDDGLTWQSPGPAGIATALYAIRFLDAQRGWAVGDDGVALATTDGGVTWTPQASGTRQALTQVFFVDARTGWIAGNNGTLLATGTGGQ